MTYDTRVILIAQEQRTQGEALAELRRIVQHLTQRVQVLEQEVATLKAAWMASWKEGAEWTT